MRFVEFYAQEGMMGRSALMVGAAALAITAFAAMPVLAAGNGGSGTTPQCRSGQVWDANLNRCVDQQSMVEPESLYEAGRDLAEAGRYAEAIAVLSRIADRGDPRVLNYLGFAHRMQGRVSVGLGYYREALRIDPDHVLARAYMGEAFLQMGDLDNALMQLSEIETRCGRDCHAYTELAAHIEAYRQRG
jgi:tetratricopeptide (TPR) repeat protein